MSSGRRRARANDDDDADEHVSLIELSSGPGGRPPSQALDAGGDGDSPDAPVGAARRALLIFVLFAAALAVVYRLGQEGGRREEADGVEVDAKGRSSRLPDDHMQSPKRPPSNPEQSDDEKEEGALTLEQIEAIKAECDKFVTLLEGYYFGKDQATKMLVNAFVDPWAFDAPSNSTKRRRADKLVDTMARALATPTQSQFLIGGIGSSVMAGHDNCAYDNYGRQLERLLGPAWRKAGMEIVFQNAGMGGACGDNHMNQQFCVGSNVSPDIDVLHYEWTYFEHGDGHIAHEDLVRWTQLLPKRPPVHILNTGTTVGPEDAALIEHYAEYGLNAFYMKQGLLNGGHDYASEKKRKDHPIDRFGPGFIGDGYHNTTRYGEEEKDFARKASLGVVMRNWHPGPLGFQLVADAFGYVYTKAMLQALALIEEKMKKGNDPRETWDASHRPIVSKNDLPEAKFCNPEYCTGNKPPQCSNYEVPTYGNFGAVVEDPNAKQNPHRGEVQNWTVWTAEDDVWTAVGKQDEAIFRTRDDKEICYHRNKCGGISGETQDGWVVFRLPAMEVGLVVLCGCCWKQIGKTMFLDNEGVEIAYNGVPVPRAEWDLWPNSKCVRVRKRFANAEGGSEKSQDHNYLAVRPLEQMRGRGDIRISHIITL